MNKRIPLHIKLYILIVLVILVVSSTLMFTGYRAYCRKVDEFCFARCREAAVAVSHSGSMITGRLWQAINTDEYRQLREKALAGNDEEIIREWLKSNDLYDRYENLISSYDETREVFEEADIYIQYMQDGITYTLADPHESLLCIGEAEEKLPEFAGYADNERVPPTVYHSEDGWLCTACEPIKSRVTGKVVGLACADMDMNTLISERRWWLVKCSLFVFLEIAVSILISMHLMGRFIARPVYRELSSMQDNIDQNTQRLTEVTAQNERMDNELRMAAQIQAAMLPSVFPAFPERTEFDLYARMDPARETGGDFYDFFLADDDHLVLVMADVSGKGMPAAMFMALCKIIIAENARMGKSPVQVLKDANREICANNREQMFVTVWLGILEISTGILVSADAGHEKVLLGRDGKWEFLSKEKSGIPLGLFSDAPDDSELFVEQTLTLHSGDVLIQYTDGVTEAVHEKKMFGEAGLLSAVTFAPSAEPKQLLDHIRQQIDDYVGGEPQFDDITMMGLKYTGYCPRT